MKPIIKSLSIALAISALVATKATAQQAVYDTSAPGATLSALQATYEIGSEVTLGGSDRVFQSFQFDLATTAWTGSEAATLSFYSNNGMYLDKNANPAFGSPGTLIASSGPVVLGLSGDNAHTSTYFLDSDFGNSVTLPDHFTWTVTFSGLTGSAKTDLIITDKDPLVGNVSTDPSNNKDAWINQPDGWHPIIANGGDVPLVPVVRMLAVSAVPEPSSVALLGLGGLACVFFVRRQTRHA